MEWVTPQEAVDRLRCTKKTLESLIRNGMVGYRREADRTEVGLGSDRLLQAMLQKANRLQQEQAEMTARREALVAQEASSKQKWAEIQSREAKLAQQEIDLAVILAKVEAKRTASEDEKAEIEAARALLDHEQAEVRETRARLEADSAELDRHRAEIETWFASMEKERESWSSKSVELCRQAHELSARSAALADDRRDMEALSAELSGRAGALAQREWELAGRETALEADIANRQKAFEEREAELREMETSIHDRLIEVSSAGEWLEARIERVAREEAALSQAKDELAGNAEQAATLEGRTEDLAREIEGRQAELRELEKMKRTWEVEFFQTWTDLSQREATLERKEKDLQGTGDRRRRVPTFVETMALAALGMVLAVLIGASGSWARGDFDPGRRQVESTQPIPEEDDGELAVQSVGGLDLAARSFPILGIRMRSKKDGESAR